MSQESWVGNRSGVGNRDVIQTRVEMKVTVEFTDPEKQKDTSVSNTGGRRLVPFFKLQAKLLARRGGYSRSAGSMLRAGISGGYNQVLVCVVQAFYQLVFQFKTNDQCFAQP